MNTFWNRAGGFAAVFCHYTNWSDQIIKTFTTGSAQVGNWRGRVMCPVNTYASGFQGKFGTHEGAVLGFHGMLLRCTTSNYRNSQNVQDY